MLKQLQGKDKSQLNFFSDSSYTNDASFNVLNELSHTSSRLVVFPYRFPREIYQDKITGGCSPVSFQDCFSDPFCWFTEEESKGSLKEKLLSSLDPESDIFIDDLLLFGRAYQCINNAGKWTGLIDFLIDLSEKHRVYVFFNPDLVSDGDIRSLKYISQLFVDIDTFVKIQGSFICASVLRKKSGKIVSNRIVILWDDSGKVILIKDVSQSEAKEISSEVDPAANLTFNLRLSETEKEARANTTLPYLLNDSSKKAYLSNSGVKNSNIVVGDDGGGGGEVMYMPDEVDDFDDEDPDDDLDF